MSAKAEAPTGNLSIDIALLPPDLLASLLALGAKVTDDSLDEDLVINFTKAIDGPAGPVSSIVIREPTAGEMLQWDRLSGVEADVKAISVVAGVPPQVVEKMKSRDFIRSSRRIAAFLD